jgi:hypothetical protein
MEAAEIKSGKQKKKKVKKTGSFGDIFLTNLFSLRYNTPNKSVEAREISVAGRRTRKRSGERIGRRNPICGFRRGWVGPEAEYVLDCHSMWRATAGLMISIAVVFLHGNFAFY